MIRKQKQKWPQKFTLRINNYSQKDKGEIEMPIVNQEVLEKKAKEKADAEKSVPTQKIGGKTYYKGAKGALYDYHGEALDSLQKEKEQEAYKKQGLNEHGQTLEQVALSNEKTKILKEKEKHLEEARKCDTRISSLKLEDFKPKKK